MRICGLHLYAGAYVLGYCFTGLRVNHIRLHRKRSDMVKTTKPVNYDMKIIGTNANTGIVKREYQYTTIFFEAQKVGNLPFVIRAPSHRITEGHFRNVLKLLRLILVKSRKKFSL